MSMFNPNDPDSFNDAALSQPSSSDASQPSDETQALSMFSGGMDDDDAALTEGFSNESGVAGLLSNNRVLIAGVAIVAAGCLGVMKMTFSKESTGFLDAAAEANVTNAVNEFASRKNAGEDPETMGEGIGGLMDITEVIDMMHRRAEDQQVPLDLVAKDPFASQARPAEDTSAQEAAELAEAQRSWANGLDREAERLTLDGVMLGANPIAIINGEFYQASQTIGSFTVSTIEDGRVELVASDEAMGTHFAELTSE